MAKVALRGLGVVEVPPEKVITFPEGLYGFEGLRLFALLAPDEESPWCCLRSLEDEAVGFVAVHPGRIFADYAPEVPEGEIARLGFGGGACLVLCLVSLLPDGRVAVNARAPLVIDPERRLGAQVILPDERWPVRFVIAGDKGPVGDGGAAAGKPAREPAGRRLLRV